MTITVNAPDYSPIERIETGLFSFDVAVSNKHKLGMPMRTLCEIYGAEHVGKSTLCYYLAGALNPTGKILLADFEGLDVEHLPVAISQSGFSGEVDIISAATDKGKPRDHEDILKELSARLFEDEAVHCAVVDSIGAILPIFERESDIGAGMPAKRATIVSEFVRKSMNALITKATPACVLVTNHSHSIIGGGYGHGSSGGVVLKHLAATRIFVKQSASDNIKRGDEVLATVLEGKLEKLRFGGKGGRFKVVIVPGYGVRRNLTAVQDCVDLELAKRESFVKIGDLNVGRITELYEADLSGDDAKFAPFYELLDAEREKLRGPK